MTRWNAVNLLAVSSGNSTATLPSGNVANKVQHAVQALYTLACDAKVDWTKVDTNMVHGLIEEMRSRLEQNRATAAEAKEWATTTH